jgi:hypothetical protein
MTWKPQANKDLFLERLGLVSCYASYSGISDVVVTGKSEPTLDKDLLCHVLVEFGAFPTVLQTNGKLLLEDGGYIEILHEVGLTTLAISIDHPGQLYDFEDVFRHVSDLGIIPRITVMLTPSVMQHNLSAWVRMSKELGIRQLTFRAITAPWTIAQTTEATLTRDWIESNIDQGDVNDWWENFQHTVSRYKVIRRLSYGAIIYDVDGVSVTYFKFCVQDSSDEDDVRSLILNQDGHLYTTWDSPASVIF